MSALRDDIEEFRGLDAEVFGVNPGSIKSHHNFAAKYGFPFPLLTDEGGAVTDAYGARKNPKGGTARTVYIVDKKGVIQYAQRGMPPDEELFEALRKLSG